MRTRVLAGLALLGAVAALVVATRGSARADGYRVDVIFDTAKGLLPGQLLKVAGVRSGEIVDVRLTRDFKARVQLRVDERFAPFTRDARCAIQPEGLIGESFVQCDPGRRGEPMLRAGDVGVPTVPVTRTTVPVSFPELFELATVPVRERAPLVINGLGLATAGRGEDLNAILRRANPALRAVGDLAAVLDRQRQDVDAAVRDSDRILAAVAPRSDAAARLVGAGARVTTRVASRSTALRAALRRLPVALGRLQTTAEQLDDVMRDATPLLGDVHAAAPAIERIVDRGAPFARAADRALRSVGSVAPQARRTLVRARGTTDLLRRASVPALTAVTGLDALTADLRRRGVVESVLEGFQNNAEATARYDDTSHLLPLRLTVTSCSLISATPKPECDAHYRAPAAAAPRRRRSLPRPQRDRPSTAAAPAPAPAAPVAPAPPEKLTPSVPEAAIGAVERLLDYLLG